jgi:hypothetical protein
VIKDLVLENLSVDGYVNFGGVVTINNGDVINVQIKDSSISERNTVGGMATRIRGTLRTFYY